MRPPVDWPVGDLLAERASRTPERPALVAAETGETWRYRDLDAAVDVLVDALAPHVGTGRIGLLSPARVAVVPQLFAAMRLGTPLVPLNVRAATADLAAQAERADLDVLVCTAGTAEVARSVAPGDCTVASTDDRDGPAAVPERDALDAEHDRHAEGSHSTGPDPDSEALLVFTSGTTGRPKGVRLTVRNLVASATASAFRLGVERGDRWLVPLPTYHVGGLSPVVRSTLYGTTTVLQRGGGFEPEATAEHLRDHEVTCVSLVPTMLDRLLDSGWTPDDRLRVVLLGGAPATQELLDRCADAGVPAWPTYGMSEASSQVATATPEQARRFPGTVGQPLLNATVGILDADGDPCAPSERGELVVDGPAVTRGYLDDEHTRAAFDDDGLHTGDVGYRDEDGRLWVTGRVDDLLVSGGENVDPNRVASLLREHPDVEDVAVVGLDDPEWGDRVAALVVPAADDLTPAALDSHARERLADYELPRTVAFAAEIPRTASGTVDRDAVRDRLRSAGSSR